MLKQLCISSIKVIYMSRIDYDVENMTLISNHLNLYLKPPRLKKIKSIDCKRPGWNFQRANVYKDYKSEELGYKFYNHVQNQ